MKNHSIKFNVFMNVILTTSSLVFPLITIPYVSRVLSTQGMGLVSFAQSLSYNFSIVSLLGIPLYGVRACAQVREDKRALSKTTYELLIILLGSTVVSTAIYIIIILSLPRFSGTKTLFLIFSAGIVLASLGVEWFYQANEQYGYITVRNLCVKIVGLALIFLLVQNGDDYTLYGVVLVFISYGSNLINIYKLRTFLVKVPISQLNIKRHFRSMLSFLTSSIATGIYSQIDVVMLGFLAPINVVGLYQLTAKIKTVCTTAVNSVANVMLPRLSFYTSHKHPRLFDKLFAKNINFLMISSFTIVGILEISPSDFVLILGGEHFAQSATSLQFLAPAIAFSAFNSFLAQYFIAKNQEKIWSITSVVGLFISIVLMLVITPLFGASGAGIGMSISEFSVLMFRAFQCRHYLASLHEHLNVAKILICGIAAAILSFVASSAFQAGPVIHLVVVSVVMAASYLMGLCISKESFTMTIMSSLKKRIFK